jgi:hypothetical protein
MNRLNIKSLILYQENELKDEIITIHCSLLTAHYPQFTAHCSLFTILC